MLLILPANIYDLIYHYTTVPSAICLQINNINTLKKQKILDKFTRCNFATFYPILDHHINFYNQFIQTTNNIKPVGINSVRQHIINKKYEKYSKTNYIPRKYIRKYWGNNTPDRPLGICVMPNDIMQMCQDRPEINDPLLRIGIFYSYMDCESYFKKVLKDKAVDELKYMFKDFYDSDDSDISPDSSDNEVTGDYSKNRLITIILRKQLNIYQRFKINLDNVRSHLTLKFTISHIQTIEKQTRIDKQIANIDRLKNKLNRDKENKKLRKLIERLSNILDRNIEQCSNYKKFNSDMDEFVNEFEYNIHFNYKLTLQLAQYLKSGKNIITNIDSLESDSE
jgi:hypothetical protein